MPFIRLLIVTVLLALLSVTQASAKELVISDDFSVYRISTVADYFEDSEKRLTFKEVLTPEIQQKFSPLLLSQTHQGFTRSNFWLRFKVKNTLSSATQIVIAPLTTHIDHLDFYLQKADGEWFHQRVSEYEPEFQRQLPYRLLNISYPLNSEESATIYAKLSTSTLDNINIDLNLSSQNYLQSVMVKEPFYYGLYYGLFAATALLMLRIGFYSQSPSPSYYFYFLAYVLCTTFMWAHENGFTAQLLWPEEFWMNNQNAHLCYLLVSSLGLLISRHFLKSKKRAPKLDLAITLLVILYLCAIGLHLFGVFEQVFYTAYASLFSLALLPLLGWSCQQKGDRSVTLFILAWLPYSVSLLLNLLSSFTGWHYFGVSPLLLLQLSMLLGCLILVLATLSSIKAGADSLLESSKQDPLTQLGNRNQLEEHVTCLQRDPERSGEHWLFLIDIDNFNQINDRLGYPVGDKVLVNLSNLLKSECRSVDLAIRWGGEEFVLLINVANEKTAYRIAERIRKTFHSKPSEISGQLVNHSVSIGLHRLDFDSHQTLTEAVEQADKALYRAKSTGRNKIIVYNEELEILQI